MTTKKVTTPLVSLTDEIKNVTLNQPLLNLSFSDYPNELEQLNIAFKQMIDRLSSSMQENIKRKSCEMQANMIALQSQMDPHFLYNILTVIKCQAHDGDTDQLDDTCNYMAEMLRYISTYSVETVSLDKELHHCLLYLKLMKTRFEDSFEYNINIEPNLNINVIDVPKLSIQPLLENCFQHGFKKVLPTWIISINCFRADNKLVVEIIDNGSGIEETKISDLQENVKRFLVNPSDSISSLSIGGMGLLNTLVRMNLRFHNNFSYSIRPLNTHGTKITFMIGDTTL